MSTSSARAAGDDCVHSSSCPERDVDDHGCCRQPQDTREVDAQRAAEAKRSADARQSEARRAATRKAVDAKKPTGGPKISIMMKKQPAAATGCPADMVHVPGTSFVMGSPAGEGEDDDRPSHRVTLAGYCLDRTEVLAAAYARCVTAGKCTAAPEPEPTGVASLCNGTRADRRDHPINCVDWNQASAYCAFMNKRLSTEAEWEYAARGPDQRLYPWGNEAPSAERLNACGGECRPLSKRLQLEASVMYEEDDGWEATAPAASFPAGASPFGVLDMAGNVAEWVEDWYRSYLGTATHYQDGPHRVIRGGAWSQAAASRVRGASRDNGNPASRAVDVGFRCARGE